MSSVSCPPLLVLPGVDSYNFWPDKTLSRESVSGPFAGIKKKRLRVTYKFLDPYPL